MKFLDICSGIGGGHFGIQNILPNATCIGFSEIDKGAIDIYSKMFSNTNNLGDVYSIDPKSLDDFDVLISGFPCQSFSINGSRKGFDGLQGSIFFKILEIVNQKKPSVLILENVKGLISHNSGKTFNKILNSLKESGYSYKYKVLNSKDFGVPQSRERIYIIAFLHSQDDVSFDFPVGAYKPISFSSFDNIKASIEQITSLEKRLRNKFNIKIAKEEVFSAKDGKIIDCRQSDIRIYNNVFPTLRASRHGIFYYYNNSLCSLTGPDSLKIQGFPSRLIKICKNTLSNNKMLFYSGNAMTVPVISSIFNNILILLNKKYTYENT